MAGLVLLFTNEATTPRVFSMGTVHRSPVVGGFSLHTTQEDPLSIEVLDVDTPFTVITDLPRSKARSFRDAPSSVGSGTLQVMADDPDVASLDGDRILRWKIDGRPATQTLVEKLDRRTVAVGEEAEQYVTVSGRSLVAILEEAVVYPSRGPATKPIEDVRIFNFANEDFNDRSWRSAGLIRYQRQTSTYWTGLPARWPAPSAGWIWAPGANDNHAKVGTCYFRHRFNIPEGVTELALFFSTDNEGEIWFDGQQVMESESFHDHRSINIPVTAGSHLLAVKAANRPGGGYRTLPGDSSYTVVSGDTLWDIAARFYGDPTQWPTIYNANQAQIQADATTAGLWNPRDPGHWIFPGQVFIIPGTGSGATIGTNPAAILVAVYEQTAEGLGRLLAVSNSSWRCLPYPDVEPGMTPGEVMGILLSEAKHRGCFPNLTWDFSTNWDTLGRGWPRVGDITVRVGDDMLTVINQLAETYVDYYMAPSGIHLSMLDIDKPRNTTPATYTPAVDITELTHERDV